MTSDDEATTPTHRRRRARSAGREAGGATGEASARPGRSIEGDGTPVRAEHVEIHQGAVGRVESERLEVVQGAVGGARADTVQVQQGALGGVIAGEVSVRQSFARSILAREVRVEQSFVRMLSAVEVRVERTTFVGVLLARRVVGDVRTLVDWRGAIAFGAAFGLVAGLVGRGRRSKDDPAAD